jgi:hypothetical protein
MIIPLFLTLVGFSRTQIYRLLADSSLITIDKSKDLVDSSYIMIRESSWTEAKVGRVFKSDDNFWISQKRTIIKSSEYVTHIGTHTDFINKFSPLLNGLSCFVFIADRAPWIWK